MFVNNTHYVNMVIMGVKLKIIIIFAFVSISLMGLSVYLKEKNAQKRITDVAGITDYSNYPVIQNIAPNTVTVGNRYEYTLGVIDADTHPANLRLNLVESPSWINADGLTVWGVPTPSDLGTNKVEIEVSDGEHSIFKTFYILVTPPDETE